MEHKHIILYSDADDEDDEEIICIQHEHIVNLVLLATESSVSKDEESAKLVS